MGNKKNGYKYPSFSLWCTKCNEEKDVEQIHYVTRDRIGNIIDVICKDCINNELF